MKHIIEYKVISQSSFLFIEMVICGSLFWHGFLVTKWTDSEYFQYLNLMPNHQMSQKRVKGRVHGANGNHEVVCYKDLKNIFKKSEVMQE